MLNGAINSSYGVISTFYKKNDNLLAGNLVRMASGKRVSQPRESIPDYFHAQNYKREAEGYTSLRQDVAETLSMLQVASSAGEVVFNSLNRMRDLVDLYYNENTTPEEMDGIEAEFSSLAFQVEHTIDNSKYNSKQLIQDTGASSLKSVNLDPKDISVQYEVKFGSEQVADVSALTLGTSNQTDETNAVQAELNKAASYLAKVSGYSQGLKSQYNIMTKKINTNRNMDSTLTDADIGQETIQTNIRNIRNQASLAMMAQANMMRSSIMRLFA